MRRKCWTIAGTLAFLACSPGTHPGLIGGCGSGCPQGQVCSQNNCVSLCVAGGGTDCSGSCVNVLTDQSNCGSCGNACAPGLICTSGSCAGTCASPLTSCVQDGGTTYCVSLQTDSSNCGACGSVCAAGDYCLDGGCSVPSVSCPSPQSLCTASDGTETCADLQSDSANCGGCGRPCDSTQSCQLGMCVTPCAPGLAPCPGGCTDLSVDGNCGGCGISCGANGFCAGSACACAAGYTLCGSAAVPACAALPTDTANCGACGNRCVPCEACIAGACTTPANILTAAPTFLTTSSAFGVAIGDLNADGLADVAVTLSSTGGNDSADELVIFFGDGGGGFPTSATVTFSASSTMQNLATGDFNGDGLTDLAIANVGNETGFFVLLGQSDGGLIPSVLYTAEPDPTSGTIKVADLNGDGLDDVVVFSPDQGVDVFFARADGTFSAKSLVSLPSYPYTYDGIDTGDIDGDGLADLVITYESGGYTATTALYSQQSSGLALAASVLGYNGTVPIMGSGLVNSVESCDITLQQFVDGGFATIGHIPVACGDGEGGLGLDLNGDGIRDLVATETYSTMLYVFLGHGGNPPYRVSALVDTRIEPLTPSFGVGDLNGDGFPDVAEASSGGVVLLFNGCGSP